MKADLYTAQVQAAAGAGLAYRTAAGFVVFTSSDGGNLIGLIEAKQHEPDLIEQIAASAPTSASAFAMLFTAGGDLYLVATGDISATISSRSTELLLRPTGDQVLVHPVSAGVTETAVSVRLQTSETRGGTAASHELATGTIDADWVEVGVGGGEVGTFMPPAATSAVEVPEVVEPVAIVPDEADEPPAAKGIVFGDDLAESVDPPEPPAPPAPETAALAAPEVMPAATAAAAVAMPAPGATPEPSAPEPPAPAEEPPAQPPAMKASAAIAGAPAMVLGVACQQGHHNHPDAVYCSQCGTKMGVHQTTVLANGPRPPLGVLVVDDGTTYSLSENLVIGREPSSHADVQAGLASPMVLTDDTLSLSRKHARIELDDWSVLVQDLGSSNGTYLSRAGQGEVWARVETSASEALEPGDRLRVGGRIIQVELHHVR